MDDVGADLAAYYADEASQRRRAPPSGHRVELRERFAAQLVAEGRERIVDIGAGPGSDSVSFIDAGLSYLGVDLAPGNGVLARESGVAVIAGSLFELPFRSATFDAGWSMSTLMHVPGPEVDRAMRSITSVLRPRSPFGIGLWGGDLGEVVEIREGSDHRRRFSLRTLEHNVGLLAGHGQLEHVETWDAGPAGWEYQFVIIRIGG